MAERTHISTPDFFEEALRVPHLLQIHVPALIRFGDLEAELLLLEDAVVEVVELEGGGAIVSVKSLFFLLQGGEGGVGVGGLGLPTLQGLCQAILVQYLLDGLLVGLHLVGIGEGVGVELVGLGEVGAVAELLFGFRGQ
eukprot:CAMPEP_0170555718 /NCGR_PEP_ID=MMETSP0211-20121228/13566_1 /TAXON_ID=311385 /ORGANISM="Pseudokeronopsis sp., Strain OXSARD2" /LENGTH=138 /DNA_ID=CAMNT_0010865697 /DNA_START=827 /DNA_END=1243 /DNA_ORIENTATION=+